MRDGPDPWRIDDLFYLEREINYWAGPTGYQACTAGIQRARDHAARHGMDRVAVLPEWSARYDGVLAEIVASMDAEGLVSDCAGARIVVMPSAESLARFVAWCGRNVRWV